MRTSIALFRATLLAALVAAAGGCATDAAAPSPPRPLLLVIVPDLAASNQTDLYTLAADGRTLHRLTDTPGYETAPSWSPDGRRIAYQLLPPTGRIDQAELHVMDADGSGDRRLAGPGDLGPPTWSPDGTRLAFDRAVAAGDARRALLVMRVDGPGLDTVLDRGAVDVAPAWSPDGTHLAFASNCLGDAAACWVTTLWTLRLADGQLTQLTFADPADPLGQDDAGAPRWSPDGATLAYQHGGLARVALLPAAGGATTPVATGAMQAWSPAWSPDGRTLAFVGGAPSAPEVWMAGADGSSPHSFARVPGILRTVHWRP